MSMVVEFSGGVTAQGLSLAVGVAVIDALQQFGLSDLQLKWPNDILHSNAKLGGILIELSGDANGSSQLAIGIGLNVCMPAAAAADIDQNWTDISRVVGAEVDRNKLLAAVLGGLLPLIFSFEEQGFSHGASVGWSVMPMLAGLSWCAVESRKLPAGWLVLMRAVRCCWILVMTYK